LLLAIAILLIEKRRTPLEMRRPPPFRYPDTAGVNPSAIRGYDEDLGGSADLGVGTVDDLP
jgi:hypothetical protein